MKKRHEVGSRKQEAGSRKQEAGFVKLFFMLLASCFLLQPIYAGSLSDLNTKELQERTSPPIKSAESPFIKQSVSPQDLIVEDLHLDGIVYSPHSAYALISGYTVREGNDIAGFKVKTVEKNRVVLRQLDQTKVLRLE